MFSEKLNRFFNVSLRGVTLISKFSLIFLLAKLLEPAEVGLYGLMTVTISYMLMAIGFDFYTYATRELIDADRNKWMALLRDQAVFYLIAYVIAIPICLLIFIENLLPWSLILWFLPLLALEHLAQEFNRLLVAISEPLWASAVLFLRQGLWAVIAAVCMLLIPDYRNLNFVLAAWLIGIFLACLLAVIRLSKIDRSSLKNAINWTWIKRGVKVALPFVFATLSLRALYTFDRYWVEAFYGLEVLAAYVLFVGIANVIMTFLDASVFTFVYPKLIKAVKNFNKDVFNYEMKWLLVQTIWITTALSIAVIFLAKPLIEWIDKPIYTDNFALLYWTMLAVVFSVLSMVPHYALYAWRQDKKIIMSHLGVLPVFCIFLYLLTDAIGVFAVPVAMTLAFFFLLLSKATFYFRAKPIWLQA